MLRSLFFKRHNALRLVAGRFNYRRPITITALAGGALVIAGSGLIYNDAFNISSSSRLRQSKSGSTHRKLVQGDLHRPDTLYSLVWGSNNCGTLAPGDSENEPLRTPTIAGWLDGVALRDLRLHEKHAACVDAKGDVYQWGDGFYGTSSNGAKAETPKRTLRGKNILQLELTEDKVYALSASGRVYLLASSAERQVHPPGVPNPSTGWFWKEPTAVDFAEVTAAEQLSWGERFTAISAGKNHLLALTSSGRVFAHPVNKSANHYGQLGMRKFHVSPLEFPEASSMEVELIPKTSADPYANASRASRTTPIPSVSENLVNIDDTEIRFCLKLFEVPVLRGVEAAQVAAGSRTSFLRTTEGRVLAWGANDLGQLGLGSHVSLDTITVPTEVVLWRFVPSTTKSKCLNVAAGGDLTSFVVERRNKDEPPSMDILMSGNGQYGGLGNSSFLNSHGEPTRVREISGLLQYNENVKVLEPIKPMAVSISPTGHVLVSLNTAITTNSGVIGGNDLMFWGKNYDSESGNGKKASIGQPIAVELAEGERLMLIEKKAKEVKDLEGNVLKRGVRVEQRAVAGPRNTVVYWKIII